MIRGPPILTRTETRFPYTTLFRSYVQQNRQRDALLALREAVTNFPDGPVARNAAQRMREVFASIYHGPGDPEVPPLRALALYQEFMELTPAGPEDRKSTRLNSSH